MEELHPQGGQTSFELDRSTAAQEPTGETRPVITQHLRRKAVASHGPFEAFPSGLTGWALAQTQGQAEPSMVIKDVHGPDRALVGQHKLGEVDLPQLVRRGPLEALRGRSGPRGLERHQV